MDSPLLKLKRSTRAVEQQQILCAFDGYETQYQHMKNFSPPKLKLHSESNGVPKSTKRALAHIYLSVTLVTEQ